MWFWKNKNKNKILETVIDVSSITLEDIERSLNIIKKDFENYGFNFHYFKRFFPPSVYTFVDKRNPSCKEEIEKLKANGFELIGIIVAEEHEIWKNYNKNK